MSKETKIQWTNHTGGPWFVCTEVTPGCAHCYARKLIESRLGYIIRKAYKAAGFKDWKTRSLWGKHAPRVLTKTFWQEIPQLNVVEKPSAAPKIFPSLIDWLDDMPAGIIDQEGNVLDPIHVLGRFLSVIHNCPNLDFLLLTKRIELMAERLKLVFRNNSLGQEFDEWLRVWIYRREVPVNIWLGFSAENQEWLEKRWAVAREYRARVHFISIEPMLERMEFDQVIHEARAAGITLWPIFGGESGMGARPCHIDWIRSGLRQFQAAGMKVFVKQLGKNSTFMSIKQTGKHSTFNVHLPTIKDAKGGDMAEWPEDLQVREFPV